MHTRTKSIVLVTAAMAMTLAGCSTASKNMAPEPMPAPVAAPAPAPAPQVVAAPAPMYVVDDVNFDFDRSTLKPTATSTLDRVATELRAQSGVPYEVAGFTDSVGSDAYNKSLSERRAATVRSYLVTHGVEGSQLSARGHGESNPVASNTTAEGRAKNRRVEIRPVK